MSVVFILEIPHDQCINYTTKKQAFLVSRISNYTHTPREKHTKLKNRVTTPKYFTYTLPRSPILKVDWLNGYLEAGFDAKREL